MNQTFWTTKDEGKILISDLKDSHLLNIIKRFSLMWMLKIIQLRDQLTIAIKTKEEFQLDLLGDSFSIY